MSDRNVALVAEYASLLKSLRRLRRESKAALPQDSRRRQRLNEVERAQIFKKTDGRCHICGGKIDGEWQADHVLAHSGGGGHAIDNYLPAHSICNNYRWDYSAAEFQHILKLGVWLRTQIEKQTKIGRAAAAGYLSKETARRSRRKVAGWPVVAKKPS